MVWILPQDLAYVPCQAYVSSGVAESEQLDVEFMQACTIHCTTNVYDILYSHFPSIPTPPDPVRGGGGYHVGSVWPSVRNSRFLEKSFMDCYHTPYKWSPGNWNESGFRPPLCTYRLNWARRTSWGWWDDWDDTVLQTQDSKFEPWSSRYVFHGYCVLLLILFLNPVGYFHFSHFFGHILKNSYHR